jgi:hypothetical protein
VAPKNKGVGIIVIKKYDNWEVLILNIWYCSETAEIRKLKNIILKSEEVIDYKENHQFIPQNKYRASQTYAAFTVMWIITSAYTCHSADKAQKTCFWKYCILSTTHDDDMKI